MVMRISLWALSAAVGLTLAAPLHAMTEEEGRCLDDSAPFDLHDRFADEFLANMMVAEDDQASEALAEMFPYANQCASSAELAEPFQEIYIEYLFFRSLAGGMFARLSEAGFPVAMIEDAFQQIVTELGGEEVFTEAGDITDDALASVLMRLVEMQAPLRSPEIIEQATAFTVAYAKVLTLQLILDAP